MTDKTPAMPELPDGATVLPDGSAFAIASFPLPANHWLYAPREYRDGEEDPIELPSPILSHQAHGDVVRAAIRYAVRGATMCGKEPDFDPDALVQNAMYALCGPFGGAALQSAQPAAVSDAAIYAVWTQHCQKPGTTTRQLVCGFARAILALRPQADHPDTARCIKARNDLNAAMHGEGALIDDLEHAVANACAKLLRPQAVPMTDEPPENLAGAFTYCGQSARFLTTLRKASDPYRYAIAWQTKGGHEHVAVVACPDHDIEQVKP